MNKNLLMAAICPHPPIIIPEVGRTELSKVSKTILGLERLSKDIVDVDPDTIIIVTPHSYLNPEYFNVYYDRELEGNFANFGAPEAKITFENDVDLINLVQEQIKDSFVKLNKIPLGTSLDHGSSVPLYYFAKAGYKGKIVVINYTAFSPEDHILFGKKLNDAISKSDKKVVFIASGDLSHRLSPSAPAGYNPEAKVFDEVVRLCFESGIYDSLIKIESDLRRKAGECGYNSIMVGIGVIDQQSIHNQVYSYEAPFGVGYLVATF